MFDILREFTLKAVSKVFVPTPAVPLMPMFCTAEIVDDENERLCEECGENE